MHPRVGLWDFLEPVSRTSRGQVLEFSESGIQKVQVRVESACPQTLVTAQNVPEKMPSEGEGGRFSFLWLRQSWGSQLDGSPRVVPGVWEQMVGFVAVRT